MKENDLDDSDPLPLVFRLPDLFCLSSSPSLKYIIDIYYKFFLSTTFNNFRLLLHFDKNHLFMTTAASGHSLEIFESKAELQFVLNKPSDLLLKPEKQFFVFVVGMLIYFLPN